jgi:DNA-binding MarR family transcriptional regulator
LFCVNVQDMNTQTGPDEISLRLLDEFTREPEVSQRVLAARLGIALGLVNTYIKRLYKKGHIKIKTLPRHRIKYIITPKGITEKARLTYTYINYSIKYFKEIRANIERTYTKMISGDIKDILLWGDGEIAELCFISTRGLPLNIVGVVAEEKLDNGFFGNHIFTIDDIAGIKFDAVLVTSMDPKVLSSIGSSNLDERRIYYL